MEPVVQAAKAVKAERVAMVSMDKPVVAAASVESVVREALAATDLMEQWVEMEVRQPKAAMVETERSEGLEV